MCRREARLEEMLDRVRTAERGRPADESRDNRANRERHQRIGHRRRRLVRAMPRTVAVPTAAIVRRLTTDDWRLTTDDWRLVRLRRPVAHLVILLVRPAVRVWIGGMRRAMRRRGNDRGVAGGLPRRTAIATKEGHRHQPEHVERRHKGGQDRERPYGLVREERAEQDLVLA